MEGNYNFHLVLISTGKRNVKADFSTEDNHLTKQQVERANANVTIMWCTMQMQWTYCCDTFQLVRVGCKIGGSTLRHQIKSRSAMFLLVCLGLRPH